MDRTENTINNSILLLRDVTAVAERCLLSHRLATGVFAEPFSGNNSLCWLSAYLPLVFSREGIQAY
jgi:hypothetical protein